MRKFSELGYSKANIRSVGITNQRETSLVWDKETGEPLYNAVVWPDTRTANLVRELRGREGADGLKELCGLPLSTYPSSVKLLWLIENVEAVKQAYDAGRLAFGTVDSWLIYKLNGGASAANPVHVTDSSNASRTMFMNIRSLQYDDTLLNFFGIDRTKIALPKIVPSSDPTAFGSVASGPLEGIPIAGCLGDQSAALVGQCGFSPGQAKNTYGTGCFLLYNVGDEPVISKSGLLATVAYDFGRGSKPGYALEGSIAVAGSGVKFLTNNLGFETESSKITDLAGTVKDNGGVVFVTAFSGLFAPYWIDDAKGTLCKFGCSLRLPTLSPHRLPPRNPQTNMSVSSRHHAAYHQSAHCPCHARGDVLPDKGHTGCHGQGLGSQARVARRGRRPVQLGPHHADAGRHHRHPGRPPGHARDDGARRGHRRRPGDGRVEDARRRQAHEPDGPHRL